jgi:hypothetical protein
MTKDNEQFQKIWDETDVGKEYKYFDYVPIYGIKNNYPNDIYKSETLKFKNIC